MTLPSQIYWGCLAKTVELDGVMAFEAKFEKNESKKKEWRVWNCRQISAEDTQGGVAVGYLRLTTNPQRTRTIGPP